MRFRALAPTRRRFRMRIDEIMNVRGPGRHWERLSTGLDSFMIP
jgi:hypothetical protein